MSANIATNRWTASDGVELAWHEVGQGPPLVLLHGLLSSAQMNWVRFGHAERLEAAGRRVIMPDLRAHGDSARPHDPAHYPAGILVRDLVELIDHLGLESYDLGGFSLGARTAAEAVADGLGPRRLVLGGMGLGGLTAWEQRKRFFQAALEAPDKVPPGDPRWFVVQFIRTMNADRTAIALLLDGIGDFDPARLALLTMPALVVNGSDDDDNGSAADLAAALPDARLVLIPGNHASSVTGPALGEAIASFISNQLVESDGRRPAGRSAPG